MTGRQPGAIITTAPGCRHENSLLYRFHRGSTAVPRRGRSRPVGTAEVGGAPTHATWTNTGTAVGWLARVPADDPRLGAGLGRADRAAQPPCALAARIRPPDSVVKSLEAC